MADILLVDDEIQMLHALEKNVSWADCGINHVFSATDFKQARRILDQQTIGMIISDIEMPAQSGLDLLTSLRKDGIEIPCLFLTCHTEFEYMRHAIQLGSADYLLKPVDYHELERVIRKLVSQITSQKTEEQEMDSEITRNEPQDRDVIIEVRQYIRKHMMDNIVIADIASNLFFNQQYLMRIFKNKSGVSLHRFIVQEKMNEAIRILEDTMLPIQVVASMVGYADQAHFTRVFNKMFGISPTKYRKKNLE